MMCFLISCRNSIPSILACSMSCHSYFSSDSDFSSDSMNVVHVAYTLRAAPHRHRTRSVQHRTDTVHAADRKHGVCTAFDTRWCTARARWTPRTRRVPKAVSVNPPLDDCVECSVYRVVCGVRSVVHVMRGVECKVCGGCVVCELWIVVCGMWGVKCGVTGCRV